MTADTNCDACGDPLDTDGHWVHVSVYHHHDPNNPERRSRDNPRNYAATLCTYCAGEVIDHSGGPGEIEA